jgi:hypothetical protein
MSMESPYLIDMDVAAQDHEIPAKGDRIWMRGDWYRVLDVSRWRERSADFERDREWLVELRVQRDRADESGVGELRPDGPRPLIAGAEAEPPAEDE